MATVRNILQAELDARRGITISADALVAALADKGVLVIKRAEAPVVIQPGDLFGPGEAAAFMGVNRTTVSRWIREGYMPPALQQLGGAGVWTRDVLVPFREQHLAAADAAGRRPSGGKPAEAA